LLHWWQFRCSARAGKTTGVVRSTGAVRAAREPDYASEKGFYSFVSGAVVGAAQKMPEENYSFKPTPKFALLPARCHVADASYMFLLASHG